MERPLVTDAQKREARYRLSKLNNDVIADNQKKLLPCPFCGEKAILANGWNSKLRHPTYEIQCTCFSNDDLPVSITMEYFNVNMAVSKWNRRAENNCINTCENYKKKSN